MRRFGAAALTTLTVCACGEDAVAPSPTVARPAVVATGAVDAHFPQVVPTHCVLDHGTLVVQIAADNPAAIKPLVMTIHAYHGTGTYSNLLGPHATTGVSIEVTRSDGASWVGSAGRIVVTTAAFSRVAGTVDATLRPDNATSTVDVKGDWACTATAPTPRPSKTP